MKKMILFLTLILISQASAFEFCDDGTQGKFDLRLISIDDMLKDNSNEWTWSPSTQIEIEARVENSEDETATYILEATFRDGDDKIKIAKDSDDLKKEFELSSGERKSISLNFEIDEDSDKGEYDLYIKFYKENDEDTRCVENSEEEITIEKIELCDDENVDEDELEITRIIDETEDNSNEWEWTPGDDIRISLDLENNDYSERTFITELIMLDEDNNEVDFSENSDDITKEKEINEDENEEFTFQFTLKPNIEEGQYTLYAKSYDEDNDNICTSLKAQTKSNPQIIEIKRSERNVIIKNVEGPNTAETFSEIQYTATVTNLGSEDEDKVLAIIYSSRLNLTQKIEIGSLDSGEEKTVTFEITIPENASISRHAVLFSTEFEYNERQDYYRSSSDEDNDIKKHLTISIGIKPEEPEVEETIIENETIGEISEETVPTTTITGNVIGPSNSIPFLPITIITIILGTIAFFILRKPKPNPQHHIQPNITRRYSAKLN